MQRLAKRLAQGSEAAFAELYDACADRLHRYLVFRLGSSDLASDLLQTVFLRAVKSRKRFAKVDSPNAYLFQIAHNEVIRQAGRTTRHARALTRRADEMRQAAGDQPGAGGTGGDWNGEHEESELVAKALGLLSAEDRELVEMKVHAGLTFREIAAVTGRPQPAVASRYRRALETMRPWLARQLQQGSR
jgi:RNA polymerase sigma-70 factor, ECF subfamily